MPKKKLIKKHTPEEYLYNPIQEMLEDAMLEEFPGCCGIAVLHGFPDDALCHDLTDEANRIEEDNSRLSDIWDRDVVPLPASRAGVRSDLFHKAPMIVATTIPSQRYANRVLPLLGFIVQQTFKGRGRNTITLWVLRKG